MKRIILTICAATLLLGACNDATKNETSTDSTATAANESTTKEKEWVPIDTATMMKAMMEYGTPGEPQKMLAKSNGTWDAQVIMWMGDGAPADTSTGSCTNKMIMGDRYQVSNFKGDMMGMPFEGMSTTAYDNAKKVFVSTWIDNMGTGIMSMEGPWDEATKSMTMTGKVVSPVDGRVCELKQVYKIVDDNTQIMEMYGPDSQTGKQYKNMKITFTRKK